MTRLLIATKNRHKTREIAAMLGERYLVEDLTAHPDFPEVEETGATFRENATLKAVEISRHATAREQPAWPFVLADDSGLEVDALGGAPGVRSARYSGEGATDLRNLELLLSRMTGVELRTARFRCAIAIARGGELLATFDGACEGAILHQPQGSHGFGYDPVFVPRGESQTFAELPAEVKNRMSHRARALHQALVWLQATQAQTSI